jgi:hypothetical protein
MMREISQIEDINFAIQFRRLYCMFTPHHTLRIVCANVRPRNQFFHMVIACADVADVDNHRHITGRLGMSPA